MSESDEDWLSLRPVEPLPNQCCGSGCKPCVFDVYQKELAQWEEAKEKNDSSLLTKKKEEVKSDLLLLNSDTFTAFKLSCVERLTSDTNLYRFELPRGRSLQLSLGQHIVLRGMVNGLEVQRAYTPINPVNAENYFEVIIKCYDNGLMSQYIKSWQEGDLLFWRGPFGGFPYEPNQYGQLLMLTSGTGLAPMLPILQCITENEEDETFVTLVGCFSTVESIYMKSLLQDLARYWNISIFYVLSKETSVENLPWSCRENTHIGRVNSDILHSVMDLCRRKPFVLICGSVTFNNDMLSFLESLGLQGDSCFVF
uniref:NADH-cytochrome b5 reductase-like isoform X1 n=1 Tax=Geotrypetes seraphini TaxID=260995 RepID=A0A6P8PB84_GEOSA|nr:NADH-cytochrome b5 reductase-like isoform X1 [Geotrypetes seraphini]